MPTNHAVVAASSGFSGHRRFERRDKRHGIFDFVFEVLRQRPVREPEAMTQTIEIVVDFEDQGVERVTHISEPLGMLNHPIEIITVGDHQFATIEHVVGCFVDDPNIAKG